MYYSMRGLKNKKRDNVLLRITVSSRSILTTVEHYIKERGYPKYIHRDHVIDYLLPIGKLDGMTDITRKRSVSACLMIHNYDKVSPCSNAFIRREVDGNQEGELPTS
jgi:hypothetical protein